MEAVRALLTGGAGAVGGAFAIVALDDQRGRRVDHVEVADGEALLLEREEPGAAGPLLVLHVEFEDAQHFLAVDLFIALGLGVPERALQQRVEEAAIR